MRLLISTLLVAGFTFSAALADGMSKADVAAAKGGHRVPQAHDDQADVGVPKNQSSVVVSVERGVRVWRPLVEAPEYRDGYEVVAPRSTSADPQYNGNGYTNGGGYGGGFFGGGLANGGVNAQNNTVFERNGIGGGRQVMVDKRDRADRGQLIVRDPHKRPNFDQGPRFDGGKKQFAHRGDRHMPQVHRHAEAPRMSPRDGGGRNMGPGPQMARPHMVNQHMARPHVMAQRPMPMARPHVQMGGPRMMMGGPKMGGPRMMARPMMKRMGGGRRH